MRMHALSDRVHLEGSSSADCVTSCCLCESDASGPTYICSIKLIPHFFLWVSCKNCNKEGLDVTID